MTWRIIDGDCRDGLRSLDAGSVLRHDRSFVGIELNPEYAAMARDRIRDDAPLLNTPLELAA